MSKDVDYAQDLEMQERAAILNTQRAETERRARYSLSHCEYCGDEIPKKRQETKGITRCFKCQDFYEKQKKRGLV